VTEAGHAGYRPATLLPAPAAARQGARAGVVSRTAAMILDIGALALATAAVYGAWVLIRLLAHPIRFRWDMLRPHVLIPFALVVAVVLLTATWSLWGRTPGDRVMGLRVIRTSDSTLHVGRAFVRAVLCVAFPVGLFWCAFSRRNASLQDLLVGSSVIYDWAPRGTAASSTPVTS
jgi:uncharacterized RDD family membrane protein YckC